MPLYHCTHCGIPAGNLAVPPAKLPEGRCTCKLCIELDEVENEAREVLQRIAERRQTIIEKINNSHDPFSSRLPLELSSNIIRIAHPATKPLEVLRALSLGAVCRNWRNIAWSTPQLWTTLHLNLHFENARYFTPLVLEWLERSGNLPLTINIKIRMDPKRDRLEGLKRGEGVALTTKLNLIIQILNDYSNRWLSLSLNGPTAILPFFHERGTPPLLRDLTVVDPTPDDGAVGNFSRRDDILRPSSVTLTHIGFRTMNIDWSNVTRARIEAFNANELVALLRSAPRLLQLEVVRICKGNYSVPDASSLCHTSLTHLTIVDPENSEKFLDCLTLPSLNSLSGKLTTTAVVALTSRSTCSLKTLCLHSGYYWHLTGVLDMLSQLPSLEDLNVEGGNELLDALAQTSAMPERRRDLLPSLRILRLPSMDFRWDRIPPLFPDFANEDSDYSQAFCPAGQYRPLKTLVITGYQSHLDDRGPDAEMVLQFQALINRGFEISFIDKYGGESLQWCQPH